ncbi:MAG: hypothetical protein MI745_14130 [Pseudomonadales bacterium]|nr:hypothetical protein [Pseudomonadales bacterium]
MSECSSCKYFVEEALACARYPSWVEGLTADHFCGEYKSAKAAATSAARAKPGKRLVEWMSAEHDLQEGDDPTNCMPEPCANISADWAQWDLFVEYFTSPDAKNPVKKDWPGAWRNWIRRSMER